MKKVELVEITPENLAKIKRIELEILKDIDRVCGILNLRYYLCAGTLLGAVRHGGFIPWDDDIDIQMPRKDYDIFLREANKHLSKNHIVSSYLTEPEFIGDFSKVVNNKTLFVEVSTRFRDISKGIYIDIFPIDGIPDSFFSRKFFDIKISLLKARISNGYSLTDSYVQRSFKGKLFNYFAAVLTCFMSPEKATLRLNKFLLRKDYSESKYVIVESKYKRLYPRSIFGHPIPVKFEGFIFSAPTQIDDYLTVQYGKDYMKLPPEDKRKFHHYCCELDLGDYYDS